jgi:Domain of unknown function (DUF4192)
MRTWNGSDLSTDTRRIRGPAELVQAVPYLLGFHPRDSLVLVGLHDGRLVVTARVDLADAGTGAVVGPTVSAMARGGSTAIVLAVYDTVEVSADPAEPLPWSALAAGWTDDIERAGCEVQEILLVADGRWWSLCCESPDCCPRAGHELLDAPTAFAAAATVSGVVALPDRTALEHSLAPAAEPERVRLGALIGADKSAVARTALDGGYRRNTRSVKRALFAAARESDAAGWGGLADEVIACFGVALASTAVRDEIWMAIDDGVIDGRPLWRALGRQLPAPYSAPPLFLYGWAAWRAGDGASANVAVDRAIAEDPRYSAADLLLAALSYGLDPRTVPRLRDTRNRRARPA